MTLTADFVTGQTVAFQKMRQLLMDSGGGLQEGVVSSGDLMVTQRGAGANMSVDVAAGQGWVQIDTGTRNGLVHVTSDAVANVAVNAADATNPRIDQVVVQYNDTAIPAGTGGNTPTLRYLPGTATAGATLNNRTGAAALPNDALLLADILVPATSTSVVNTNIRDRRKWARGAKLVHNVPASYGTDATTGSASYVNTNLFNIRIELSGAPVRLAVGQLNAQCSVGGGITVVGAFLGTTEIVRANVACGVANTSYVAPLTGVTYTLAAGSYVASLQLANVGGGTAKLMNSGSTFPHLMIDEMIGGNQGNNTTTSG